MNEKISSQILDIRNSGAVNMFSVNEVQRLAFEKDYHELVIFIEERKADYVHFMQPSPRGRLNSGFSNSPTPRRSARAACTAENSKATSSFASPFPRWPRASRLQAPRSRSTTT